MTQRILTLTLYLFRSLLLSLSGLLYFMLTLAYYIIFLDPRQHTPDTDYYILVLGLFGAGLTFLVTLTVAARANQSIHYPLIVRLQSRVEYLTAVMLSAITFAFSIQIVVAIVALLLNGPDLALRQMIEIPPLWIAANILFGVLALHASDLVTSGWSRVYIYGVLLILLYGRGSAGTIVNWFANLLSKLGNDMLAQGWVGFGSNVFQFSNWLSQTAADLVQNILGLVFWPFSAIANATINGAFNRTQSLAPAVMLLYATILFLLAADFLATKDLYLTE
ncbi:MAG: hypothetical protein WAM60_23725 [Candidatus Promineifilaceae bacterium]